MALNALANGLDMPRVGLVAAPAISKPLNKVTEQKALARTRCGSGSQGPKNLAGVEGFEPANAGIKIRCLNQLGDSPTRVDCQRQPTDQLSLDAHPNKG